MTGELAEEITRVCGSAADMAADGLPEIFIFCNRCGAGTRGPVPTMTDRAPVTCKRCLASLVKRDREFQRKARRGIKMPPPTFPPGVWPGPNSA
jgi:hypothetical protein